MKKIIYIALFLILLSGCSDKKDLKQQEGISLSKAMGEVKSDEFSKAFEKRAFEFPEDHGPHNDFRTEWWYFTGNLTSDEGKLFGYQFTIFRTALSKDKEPRESEWNSNQIYMAHFAVTDISGERFYFDERFSREGNALAGAQTAPMRIWLEDWEIVQAGNDDRFDLPPLRISAGNDKVKINLLLEAGKSFVLQGDSGLSRKGSQPGNASYYYSYTNLSSIGIVETEGKKHNVSGKSWMDREWSTSALSGDQSGWDWFALQLDDSTELMYYQMRKNDGTPDVFSKGIIVRNDGSSKLIFQEDVELEVTDSWQSTNGIKYPSGWKLSIPSMDTELKLSPALKDQLLDVSVKYWEGSVKIEGVSSGRKVSGRGYVELTGY